MDTRPIGIFDSGVGGLTVLSEIEKVLPEESYIYIGDTKRFPYGSKSREAIIELAKRNINYLIKRNVKMIIIACGTATSQALEEVKKIYKIPIIGIIQPTILNQIQEKKENIGIIATRGTIHSHAWKNEILKKNPNVRVIEKETPLLASMAEEGWIDNIVAKEAIREYMMELKNKNLDKLILGCTHYPMFEKLIKEELSEEVSIINTGKEIAKYLQNYLKENNMMSNIKGKEEINLTDIECNFLEVAEIFLQRKVKIKQIEI